MNNFALFVCGLAITLLSGFGIAVWSVSLAYKGGEKKKPIKTDAVDLTSVERSLDPKVSSFSKC